MGVYIKDMTMPKGCVRCPWWDTEYEKTICRLWEDSIDIGVDENTCRPDWCPLVELPPHGRLIDQNALKLSILNLCFHDEVSILKNILGAVNNAPVIIEAEEET